MNRIHLQELAELRIREARILLEAGSYPGAYYLAGYAVECALKACIAKKTKEHDFPDKETTNRSWTHDLEKLLRVADLLEAMARDRQSNKAFDDFWIVVVDWNEKARYEPSVSQDEARNLCDAVSDPANGVLQWLKMWW